MYDLTRVRRPARPREGRPVQRHRLPAEQGLRRQPGRRGVRGQRHAPGRSGTVTGSTPGDSDPSVGIGNNGTVYFGYQAADGHARRRDQPRPRQDLGRRPGRRRAARRPERRLPRRWWPATTTVPRSPSSAAPPAATTRTPRTSTASGTSTSPPPIDGGKTWKTVDATPTDPVQRGSICTGGTTCGNDRNLLDFMDITVDGQGRVLVGYADGCTGACAAPGGAQNFDALATIARQTAGPAAVRRVRPEARPDGGRAHGHPERQDDHVLGGGHQLGRHAGERRDGRFGCGSTTTRTSQPITLAPGASATVTATSTSFPAGTEDS